MTVKDQIISLWRKGHDTYEISRRMTAMSRNRWTEPDVHKVIIAERNERLAKTNLRTIEGGMTNG